MNSELRFLKFGDRAKTINTPQTPKFREVFTSVKRKPQANEKCFKAGQNRKDVIVRVTCKNDLHSPYYHCNSA